MSLPKITFLSASTNSAASFTCGQGFKQGDVPAGAGVIGMQCTPKTTWPDGSLKFAVMAATAAITGGTPLDIQLSLGTPTGGTAVSLTNLKATGIVASIGCGSFGTASWATTDWDSPFMQWVSGSTMSTWIYRKPVGSDAHLVAWLRINCWANGAVEVLPWIENGYLQVAGPTNKNATYTFTLGGTQRFSMAIDAKHHQRTPLINGTALSYWLGNDPGVSVSHDRVYLQSTDLVPSYRTTRSATGLSTLPATWSPFDKGGIIYRDNRDGPDVMKNPGYQWPIGLLGEHDAAYLFCNDQPELLYGAVVRNGFVAGRYPIHYRDEAGGVYRAPSLTAYPNLTVTNDAISGLGAGGQTTPTPTGGVTTIWDGAHHPSCGYMAYTVTGDFYHLETLQLINAGNFYSMNSINNRAGGQTCRFIPDYESVQTRQAAWGMRTLAQALSATPDNDPVRTSLIAIVTALVNYYHATFVAQPNNQFGFIEPGESGYAEVLYASSYNSGMVQAGWQDDFFTASYGYALAMGLPLTTTVANKLSAFFAWKAKCVIGRLGPSSGFRFENCDTYVLQVSTNDKSTFPDYQGGTGPWPASWASIYTTTIASELGRGQTWVSPVVNNTVSGEYDISVWPSAMLGNLMPAIAYAKRFGVAGADAAHTRLTGASNWAAIQSSFVNNAPLWDVVSSGTTSSAGGTLSTPGPSFIWDSAPLVTNSFVWDIYRGLGIPLSAVPSGGTNGTSAIRALIESGDSANSEARVSYTSTPTGFLSGGDTSYTSPAGAVTYTAYLDGPAIGSATDTVGTGSSSTVTSVTVSPSTATGSTNFTAVVNGTGSPSQSVTWSRSGSAGSINSATGAFVAPSPLSSVQVITVTATSTQDGTKSGTAPVTIPASVIIAKATTVTFAVVDQAGVPVNASGLDYAFYDQPRISAGFAPVKAGSNLAIQNGVATISIANVTNLYPGDKGRIEWGDANGTKHGGGPVTVT